MAHFNYVSRRDYKEAIPEYYPEPYQKFYDNHQKFAMEIREAFKEALISLNTQSGLFNQSDLYLNT